ncbi:MAG: nucleoside recognition domain-containing protein, partial [Acutalibacteraceae bacterium]
FPTIIAMISVFITAGIGGYLKSAVTALVLLLVVLVAVAATWGASKLLSKTVLRGENSSFLLELPPFRTPQFHRVIVRSLLDRTLFVLLRAVSVAAPAGLLIWIMANINVGGASILAHCAGFFEPFGRAIGLDGIIIMAFLLGFPANEIVIPIILMGYLQTGALTGYSGPTGLHSLLVANGWTLNTAICMIVMVLFHYPCATTLMTVYKETKSVKWTALTAALPTAIGIAVCFLITLGFRIF